MEQAPIEEHTIEEKVEKVVVVNVDCSASIDYL